ncbi:MAG: FHA domain-containing protein [Planctomycetota bacterium]
MLTLTVTDGPKTGITLEAKPGQRWVIGRQGKWLRLPDPRASRQHAEITQTSDGWQVADLGSTNGTFVNSQRLLGPMEIGEGDVIRIGRTHMAVSMMLPTGSSAEPEEPKPDVVAAASAAVAPPAEPEAPAAPEPAPQIEAEPAAEAASDAHAAFDEDDAFAALSEPMDDATPAAISPSAAEDVTEAITPETPIDDAPVVDETASEPEPEPQAEPVVDEDAASDEPAMLSPISRSAQEPAESVEIDEPSDESDESAEVPEASDEPAESPVELPAVEEAAEASPLTPEVEAEPEPAPEPEPEPVAELEPAIDAPVDTSEPAEPIAASPIEPEPEPRPEPEPVAGGELPSPDFDDEPSDVKPGMADSISAWDELELSPWEDGEDIAALLSDDDEADAPPPTDALTDPSQAASGEAGSPPADGSDDDDTPPGLLPRRSPGKGALIWVGVLVLVTASIWAGQQLGVVDVSGWVTRSAEPAPAEETALAAATAPPAIEEDVAERTEAPTDAPEPAVPEVELSATAEPTSTPIAGDVDVPSPADTPVVPAEVPAESAESGMPYVAAEPIETEPALSEAQPERTQTEPAIPAAAEADVASSWLDAMAPATAAPWVDAAPEPRADRAEPTRVQSLSDPLESPAVSASIEPQDAEVIDDLSGPLALSLDDPSPFDDMLTAAFPSTAEVAIAREVSTDGPLADAPTATTPDAPEPDAEAGALADALAELDAPRAVVTAGPSGEGLKFVEVQGQPTGSLPDAASVVGDPDEVVPHADPAGPGERVVYLVDASGSMIDSFGAVGGWLERDIARLSPDDRFAVLFFSDGRVIDSPPPGLKRPTARRRTELGVFMQPTAGAVIPAGRSDATEAIAQALTYQPDRLIIVSDNNLQRRVSDNPVDALVAAILPAVGQSPDLTVDTVQLFYDDPRGVMSDLAARFGGRFELVRPQSDPDAFNPADFLIP